MGCNCKEKAGKLSKYTDDKKGVMVPMGWLEKCLHFVFRLLMVTMAISLCVVILPFFLIYLMVKMLLGKEVNIQLSKLIKRNSKKS